MKKYKAILRITDTFFNSIIKTGTFNIKGIPEDAEYSHCFVDQRSNCIHLVYSRDKAGDGFHEVAEGSEIPSMAIPTITRTVSTEWKWNETGCIYFICSCGKEIIDSTIVRPGIKYRCEQCGKRYMAEIQITTTF